MNALTLKNSQTDTKIVVVSPSGIVRPVAMASENATHQCVVNGDVLIYKNIGNSRMRFNTYGTNKRVPANKVMVEESILKDISKFLDNDSELLPSGLGWDGENTIQTVAIDLGLDKFLTGLPSTAALGGLMNLDASLYKPKVGSFDVPSLFKQATTKITNKGTTTQINRLVNSLEQNYGKWLTKNGLCLHGESVSWRYAKQLPEVLSVSCILDDKGNPLRFNDLVIWRDLEEEPEVVSIFDLVTTFKMNTNFITLPYVVDEDVKRIMYVLHDETLSDDGDNVVWLYIKR